MIESNANEVAIDKYAQPKFETLEKMEQPTADIEKAIKNWEKEKINRIEKPRTQIREEKQREMRQELQKSSRIRAEDNNKDPKCKLPKLVIPQLNGTHINYFKF